MPMLGSVHCVSRVSLGHAHIQEPWSPGAGLGYLFGASCHPVSLHSALPPSSEAGRGVPTTFIPLFIFYLLKGIWPKKLGNKKEGRHGCDSC